MIFSQSSGIRKAMIVFASRESRLMFSETCIFFPPYVLIFPFSIVFYQELVLIPGWLLCNCLLYNLHKVVLNAIFF